MAKELESTPAMNAVYQDKTNILFSVSKPYWQCHLMSLIQWNWNFIMIIKSRHPRSLLPHATLESGHDNKVSLSLSLSLMEAVRCGAAASWMSMAARDGAYPYALG